MREQAGIPSDGLAISAGSDQPPCFVDFPP